MDYPWAVPGAKVVMAKGYGPRVGLLCDNVPVEGQVYTIREVLDAPRESDGVMDLGIRLVEVVNPEAQYGPFLAEPCWHIERFRPLITQSDDVAKFTHLLNTQDNRVDA